MESAMILAMLEILAVFVMGFWYIKKHRDEQMSTILVDVDGVVADTHVSWLVRYNRDFNDDLTPSEITRWAMHEFVKPECDKKIYDYLSLPDFYDDCPPIAGAMWGIVALRAFGHRVVFVSAGLHENKVIWLAKLGFLREFPYKNDPRPTTAKDIILANDKSLIRADYMIDDREANFDGFVGEGLLFTQPWNQDSNYKYRMNDWCDIIKFFSKD